VAPLGRAQIKRVGDRLEHLGGGMDAASLLDPRVVLDTDPGKQRELFAPQPGHAPPAVVAQADVLRFHPGSPRPQELP
jgi:hypothetical protein